jgi:hypothetical protein
MIRNTYWDDVLFPKQSEHTLTEEEFKKAEDELFNTEIGRILLDAAGYDAPTQEEFENAKMKQAKKHFFGIGIIK